MRNLPILGHSPRTVQIEETRTETQTISSLLFHDELCAKARPGQFVMVWIPGVDEIPMCLSHMDGNSYCGVSVRAVGEATSALGKLKTGQKIGIRGPYGNGFRKGEGRRVLVVAGGTGITCLAPMIEELALEKRTLSLVVGARTGSELVFLDRIKKSAARTDSKLLVTTDDGSFGSKGLAPEYALKLLDAESFDEAYTCGPELMMAPVVHACVSKKIPVQASLERYMKCGIGICGSCVIGSYRVCKDGPVFNGQDLAKLSEFGKSRRDASGTRQSL